MQRRVTPLILIASLVLGSAASVSQADQGTPPTEVAVDVTATSPAPLSPEPTPSISVTTPDAPVSPPQATQPVVPSPSILTTPAEPVPSSTQGVVSAAPQTSGTSSAQDSSVKPDMETLTVPPTAGLAEEETSAAAPATAVLTEAEAPTADSARSTEGILNAMSPPLPLLSTHPTVKLGDAVQIGHGWTPENIVFPGDWDGNGHQDLMLRNASGDLIFYPATSTVSFNQPRKIGTGWNKAVDILGGVDWTGDNHMDILARFTDGTLVLYTGNSTGAITSSRQIGNGWQSFTELTPLARSRNGQPALLAEQPDGTTTLYPTRGSANFLAPVTLATNHDQLTLTTGVSDWDANNYSDITAVDASGNLRYLAAGTNATTLTHYKIGNGWNTMTAISSDQYNNTNTGLLALRGDGKLFRYPVTTVATFNASTSSVTTSELGDSWHSGCPIGASGLIAVSMNHWTPSGGVAQGTVVVRSDLASQTISIFEAAFDTKFPIAKMRPAAVYGGDDVQMMSDDNTSGFNCRQVVGNPYRVSPHSYGYALDINPYKNPYYAAGRWYPTSEYATGRSASIPGMHMSTTVFPVEVTRRGGHWGVCYSDYHHFELGRPRC